jgi:hypothetical protein
MFTPLRDELGLVRESTSTMSGNVTIVSLADELLEPVFSIFSPNELKING